jgi:hypothetical protein
MQIAVKKALVILTAICFTFWFKLSAWYVKLDAGFAPGLCWNRRSKPCLQMSEQTVFIYQVEATCPAQKQENVRLIMNVLISNAKDTECGIACLPMPEG